MSGIAPTTEIVVCLKWVFQANEPSDARFAGMSPADHAALELALRWAEHTGGAVTAISVGPFGAETMLREALACGVAHAVRIDAPVATDSTDVAAMIASAADQAAWIWCGDYSTDNGSGSVPTFLAAALQARQALGVVSVSFNDGGVSATRRVDGGRREVLDVRAPAVISVEGATARLRRASLTAMRTAATAAIDVVTPTTLMRTTQHTVHPYRPRARALAAPTASDALDRVRTLTMSGATSTVQHDVETLAPAAAAARIIDSLRDWGYL